MAEASYTHAPGRIEQIADNVYSFVENRGSNDSMVITDEGLFLIDPAYMPTDALKWREFVLSKGEVRYLVNTDHHLDHCLGSFFLPGTLIAHEGTRRKMTSGITYFTPDWIRGRVRDKDPEGVHLLDNLVLRLPDITVNDRMTVHLGGLTFEIMHRKGHTANGLAVYLPEQKILFSGDCVCEGVIPSFQEPTVFELFDTLKHFMTMDIDIIVPGHGKVCTKDRVYAFYAEVEELVDRVRAEMRKGVSRKVIQETIRYEDRIHYPQSWVDELQHLAMGNIYDCIKAREGWA